MSPNSYITEKLPKGSENSCLGIKNPISLRCLREGWIGFAIFSEGGEKAINIKVSTS